MNKINQLTQQRYKGRGPLQLSWNYNYGPVSRAIWNDNRLLTDPDQVSIILIYFLK